MAAMVVTTPRYNFFDKSVVKDPEGDGNIFDQLKSVDVSCSTSGRGQIVVGDMQGNIFVIDKQFSISPFEGYSKKVTYLYQLRQNNLLFSIGEDEEGDIPLLKVWHMDKMDSSGTPHCSRICRLILNSKDTKAPRVTAFTVHESMQSMAVGFADGSTLAFRGDITKDRTCKHHVVYTGRDPVTGLAYRVVNKSVILFITFDVLVVSMDLSSKDKDIVMYQEQFGCPSKCSAMTDDTFMNRLLIGRIDAVYSMVPEGRGAAIPLAGEKYQIHWYRGYLVIVGRGNINVDMDIVTIYDTTNKFIAYSGPIPRVSNVLFEWNAIYVLGGDNRFYALLEKATQTKLEILFKKNQYQTAINIAKSQHYDAHGLIDIFRQYGDYLYTERGDHDGAIEQYMKTIGKLEPSYVIRKFLDAQRIHNLTSYLEELHNKHQATEDHTTLLLNCYTKLKDEEKLDEFIQRKDGNNEVNFEVETAIKVLRQSDYHRHALQLAERHGKHEWYMKLQLENIKDFPRALQYMENLTFHEAEDNLKKYGRILVNAVPCETTELLKRLCLGKHDGNRRARPDEFIHIFLNNSQQLTEFLEAMINSDITPATIVYNTLLELYLQNWAHEALPTEKAAKQRRTLNLLQDKTFYDIDQALILCQMNKFKPGILFLYEKGRLYQQIVRYYMELDDHANVIGACKQWGHLDTHLWVMALSYFAEKEENCKEQMKEVLTNIDQKNLLPPLLVIQTLANSRVCTLGVVKDFIMERLQSENRRIEEDEKMIKQFTQDTQSIRKKIGDLKNKPQIFQSSRCSVCNHSLELPSIHFLCQHSYHQHCFESYAENENECPACQSENRKMLETIKQQEEKNGKDISAGFTKEMERSRDGFDVVADYFGKGIFNKPMPVNDTMSLMGNRNEQSRTQVPTTRVPAPRRNPFDDGSSADMGMAGVYRASSPNPAPYRSSNITATYQASRPYSPSHPSTDHGATSPYGSSPQQGVDVVSVRPGSEKSTAVKSTISAQSTRSTMIPPVVNVPDLPKIVNETGERKGHSRQGSNENTRGHSRQGSTDSSKGKGHNRQSSAGRLLDTGKAFFKGHMRQSSDQTRVKVDGGSKARNLSSAPTKSYENSTQSASIGQITTPPTKSASNNPFDESTKNPFEEQSSNPFEESSSDTHTTSSNPFGEPPVQSSNPFETDEPINPFEEQGKNPFE